MGGGGGGVDNYEKNSCTRKLGKKKKLAQARVGKNSCKSHLLLEFLQGSCNGKKFLQILVPENKKHTKARFRRRSTRVRNLEPMPPNLTDELSTEKERRLNQFATAILVWCGKSVKFVRVCRTFVELT